MKRGPDDVSIYFPFFPRNWLTGAATFTMNNRQRGAFVQMLAHAWGMDASLPNDEAALAKYADESIEWLRSAEGAAVLAQWPVGEDGRRRNSFLSEVYLDAIGRRVKRHNAAVVGAQARWSKGEAPAQTELPMADVPLSLVRNLNEAAAPNLADAIASFPSVTAFAAMSPEHTKALHRALMRVYDNLGDASLPGFIGEVNGALQGMHGPARSADEMRRALEDWCDNVAPLTKNALRAYFRGATTTTSAPTGSSGARRARPSPIADAGLAAAYKLD